MIDVYDKSLCVYSFPNHKDIPQHTILESLPLTFSIRFLAHVVKWKKEINKINAGNRELQPKIRSTEPLPQDHCVQNFDVEYQQRSTGPETRVISNLLITGKHRCYHQQSTSQNKRTKQRQQYDTIFTERKNGNYNYRKTKHLLTNFSPKL